MRASAYWRENELISLARFGLPEFDHTIMGEGHVEFLAGLNATQRRVLRNAVFALEGYVFSSRDLAAYFHRFPWYTPDSDVGGDVSALESNQRRLIEYIDRLPPPPSAPVQEGK